MANLALRRSVNSFMKYIIFSYEIRFSLFSVKVVFTISYLQAHHFHVMEAVACCLASVL